MQTHSTTNSLMRLPNIARLSKLSIDPFLLGSLGQIPIEILRNIIGELDLNNMLLSLSLVCRSFPAIVFPFFQYITLHLVPSKSQSDLRCLHNAYDELMNPRLFPRLISIEPGKKVELRRTNLSIQILDTTYDKRLSSKTDISQVCCLKLSSNRPIYSDEALEFLKAHQLPKVKAITFNNLAISMELLIYLDLNFKLECLSCVQCVFDFNCYREIRTKYQFIFQFLREFLFELDCTTCEYNFGLPQFRYLEACRIRLSGKNTLCKESFTLFFDSSYCRVLKYLKFDCHPSFNGELCGTLPMIPCLTHLKCNARPTQLNLYASNITYSFKLKYVKLHKDIGCIERNGEREVGYLLYTILEGKPDIELVYLEFFPTTALQPYLKYAINYDQQQQRKKRNYKKRNCKKHCKKNKAAKPAQ